MALVVGDDAAVGSHDGCDGGEGGSAGASEKTASSAAARLLSCSKYFLASRSASRKSSLAIEVTSGGTALGCDGGTCLDEAAGESPRGDGGRGASDSGLQLLTLAGCRFAASAGAAVCAGAGTRSSSNARGCDHADSAGVSAGTKTKSVASSVKAVDESPSLLAPSSEPVSSLKVKLPLGGAKASWSSSYCRLLVFLRPIKSRHSSGSCEK